MPRKKNPLAKDTISRRTLGNIVRRRAVELGLSRNAMAKLVDDAPSQMSRLMGGHDEEFSADRLAKFAKRLSMDVVVQLRPHGTLRRRGKVSVHLLPTFPGHKK